MLSHRAAVLPAALALVLMLSACSEFGFGVRTTDAPAPIASSPASTPTATATASTPSTPRSTPSTQASQSTPSKTSGAKAKALAQLKTIKVAEANYGVPYNRTQDFGTAWYDYDDNGCDTRNDVLQRDLTQITYRSDDPNCTVATGVLQDPYTGKRIDFVRGVRTSQAIQIDHMIPLHYAWMHGAYTWSADRRLAYANDQKNVLLAVDGPANGQKSDGGPADWMPSNATYHCTYVEKFTNVAAIYKLSISRRDAAKIKSVLVSCK